MGTFGSRTTPATWPHMRRAAAAAREVLLDLAAEQWKVDRGRADRGGREGDGRGRTVAHPSARLTKGRKLDEDDRGRRPRRPPHEWKVAGHTRPQGATAATS